jgi:dipeptidyl aminopeptidase/acylaminoacyl peptidase
MRPSRFVVPLLCALLFPVVAARPAAQAPSTTAFTAEDMLKVVSVRVLDLSDDGMRVAVALRRAIDNADTDNYRSGDPTYMAPSRVQLQIIDTRSGAKQVPFKGLASVRQAAWSHDGKRLAVLVADNPDEPAPVPAVTVPAREGEKPTTRSREKELPPLRQGPVTRLYIWNVDTSVLSEVPGSGAASVSGNTSLGWTPDDARLVLTTRPSGFDAEARKRFDALTKGPVIVHDAKDPFLEWDALRRSSSRRTIVEVDPASGARTAIVPEANVSSYSMARDGSFVTFLEDVTEKTDYDVIGGTENRLRLAARPPSGEPKTLVEAKDLKGVQLRWSDDGRWFAYAKKGEIFVQGIDGSKARSLTPPPPEAQKGEAAKPEAEKAAAAAKAGDKPEEERESFSVLGFSRDGTKLLASSKKGYYVFDVAGSARDLVLPLDEDEEKNPRRSVVAWSPDGSSIYMTESDRERWNRGLVRLDIATRKLTPLVKDSRLYSGFRVSRSGSTFVFTMSDGDQPADLYAADASLGAVTRLTTANAWMADRRLPKSELVSYRDADGKVMYGVLRYPTDYVKGQRYPTVFEVYETFFDNGFSARAAFLANNGYAVFNPSVNMVVGRPGEAWIKGVTAAANRLIEMGIADAERLGVHGTSYGGYATVLLITQTDRFKAAINISGKVDMVSFYTDSPRLGVRNTHAPEKSQDRLGGTLWEYPERYLEHSAILRADRIKTPLLCITGDQDPNVPASQSREIYYALRRLGKEVEWVRYVNGAHRPPSSAEEGVDFEKRILGWYDKYLKAEKKQRR